MPSVGPSVRPSVCLSHAGISLARWEVGVQGFLKVMILLFKVFFSVARVLQVGVFYNKKTLLVWPYWVNIHCCIGRRSSSLAGWSGRSPGYYVSQELSLHGTLIQARDWDLQSQALYPEVLFRHCQNLCNGQV